MSQNSITLSCNQGGTTYTDKLNEALAAVDSLHSGGSAPTANITDGKLWLDTSAADNVIKVRLGATGGTNSDGWHNLFDFDGTDFFAEQAETATTAGSATTAGACTGNSATATSAGTLITPRAIAVSGAVTGTANFDGSAGISIATTLQNHSAGLLTTGTVSNDRLPATVSVTTLAAAGAITAGTTITALGDITAFSDKSLKADIQNIPNAMDKVSQLNGVTFTRKDIEDGDKRHTGVIAQDVERVLPEAVHDHDGVLSVAYGNIVGLLIEGMKEQQMQINNLREVVRQAGLEEDCGCKDKES